MRKFITILFILCFLPAWANTVDEAIARGNYSMTQGNYQEAIGYYNQALQIDPYNRNALFYKASAYQCMSDWKNARNSSDKVLDINSNDTGGLLLRGLIQALGFGDYSGAINFYDRVLAIDPSNAYAWSYRGNAYGGLNDADSAILSYNRALNIDPGFTYTQYWKDMTLMAKDNQQWAHYHEWMKDSQKKQAVEWYSNNQLYNNNQNNNGYHNNQGNQGNNNNQNNNGYHTNQNNHESYTNQNSRGYYTTQGNQGNYSNQYNNGGYHNNQDNQGNYSNQYNNGGYHNNQDNQENNSNQNNNGGYHTNQ